MMSFDFEAVPGRPGRTSVESGFARNAADSAERDAAEGPSLPLPPGRRPKDGSYPRPGDSPSLKSDLKVESGRTFLQPRKSFKLKFPGSPTKPQSTSRIRLPFQSSQQPPKGVDHSFSVFNPVSGHRFGSSIARRMLEQLTVKKQSLWRRCLRSKPEGENQRKAPPSNILHLSNRRRLDLSDEGLNPITTVSGAESLPTSPGHGFPIWSTSSHTVTKHTQPSSPGRSHQNLSNSSPVAATQLLQPSSPGRGHSRTSSPVVSSQVQLSSSRFMASMLISLCLEPDDPDDHLHCDAVDEIADTNNDGHRSSSSPDARPSECSVIVIDPASQTLPAREECRCTCKLPTHISARSDSPTPRAKIQRRTTSKSVRRSLRAKLATAGSPSQHLLKSGSPLADRKDIDAGATPDMFSKRRVSMRRRFPEESEFAEENFERWGGFRSQAQGFSADHTSSSSSSESNSQPNTGFSRAKSFSPSFGKDVEVTTTKPKSAVPIRIMANYLSPPRSSNGDSDYISSNRDGSRKAFGRWRSSPAKPSFTRESLFEGRSELWNQPPLTRSATVKLLSPPRKQAWQQQQRAMPWDNITLEDRQNQTRFKSFSKRRIPSRARRHAVRNDDTDDSDDSTDSPLHTTPRAVSPPTYASQKPPSLISVSADLLKSPSLVKFKLQRQQSHRSAVHETVAIPGPTFEQVLLARSRDSVRSSTSRMLPTPRKCVAISADTNLLTGLEYRRPPTASRLVKSSNSSVMSKVAEWEAKVGRSAPLYRLNQRIMSTSSNHICEVVST